MRILRTLAACALLALAGSVTPARADGTRYLDPVFAVSVIEAIPYGAATNNLDQDQVLLLDLYVPDDDTLAQRPAIVFAHGGGFTGGNKDEPGITALAIAFAERGYVTASISYRIRPSGTPGSPMMQDLIVDSLTGELPPAMHDAQHDMQAAVRWMRKEAATYGIDPAVVIAAGVSAGASMALEAAFNPDDEGTSGSPGFDPSVSAAVSISGATDPRRIEPGAPPIKLFNGTHDSTAPYLTAVLACAATTAMLNTCELETYVGSGHDLGEHDAEIVALSADFLCRVVLDGCD
jgi:acetyl esterase/lipase